MQETIYINTGKNHNKFWIVNIDKQTLTATIRWGRLGTQGQSQIKQFNNDWLLLNFIETKVIEKQRKGYHKTTKTIFDKLCIEAAIVGTSNKCKNFEWVDILNLSPPQYKTCDELRLQDPNCNPGITVIVETRKSYGGRNSFHILFTADTSIDLGTNQTITKANPIYEMVQKVEEAIGRSLTA